MEFQITKEKIKINKNKKIGHVLFIVEGDKTEFYILKKIFTEIFNYNYQGINRNNKKIIKFTNEKYNNSSIYVINTENSSIKSIDKTDYLDEIFESLIDKYNFHIDNSRIYFIFDRDKDPAETKEHTNYIKDLIKSLTNSFDIEESFNRQGLLILSYPCLESFVASNFIDNAFKITHAIGNELKNDLQNRKINQSKINEQSLIKATIEMLKYINIIHDKNLEIDNFKKLNLEIFEKQEEFYKENKSFKLLSLIPIILIDLGLIILDDN